MLLTLLIVLGLLAAAGDTRSETAPTPEVERIYNKEIWKHDTNSGIDLVADLEIGVEEGDENFVFGRIFDIDVDKSGLIYVLDNAFSRVQVFDAAGAFVRSVGRPGEGPGDLATPTAIAVHDNGRLFVAGGGRVSVFDVDGQYVDSFQHGVVGSLVRSLKVDPEAGLFVACLDIMDQDIVHRYDFDSARLLSFCKSYAYENDVDTRVEQVFGGGSIDLGKDGTVYFSQLTPYEIRTFSILGEPLRVVHRENEFMTPPEVDVGDGQMTFQMPPTSTAIVVLSDERFVNTVQVPSEDGLSSLTILDAYDRSGKLVATQRVPRALQIRASDDKGFVYAIDFDDFPSVTRYKMTF